MHSDTTSETPKPTNHAASFLARAKLLLQKTSLAVVPLAAAVAATEATAQPSMTSDYSVVGSQTSSGWFTGALPVSESDAAASSAGNITNISAARSITDGLFWRYDSYYQETRPGYDTTGLRFYWGGKLEGGVMSGDTLDSVMKFTLSFNHTQAGQYDNPSVNYELKLGYGTSEYVPAQYSSSPTSYSSNYASTSGSFSSVGTFESDHSLSTTFYSDISADQDLYWFVLLDVHWQNEFVSASRWSSGDYSKLNGDTLSVTVPEGFSSVTFNSTAVSAIPEPAHFAGIFGAVAVGVLCWRRRNRKLAS